jgi:hypothetical protein
MNHLPESKAKRQSREDAVYSSTNLNHNSPDSRTKRQSSREDNKPAAISRLSFSHRNSTVSGGDSTRFTPKMKKNSIFPDADDLDEILSRGDSSLSSSLSSSSASDAEDTEKPTNNSLILEEESGIENSTEYFEALKKK